MLNITVHDQAVQQALAALAQRVNNPGALLQDIGEGIAQRAKARFTAQAGPDGQAWKPKKKADGRPTLVGPSGDLRRQIVRKVAGNAVEVRATMAYSAIHQFGGQIERAPFSMRVRHRTDAKGNLLRSQIMNGKGLIFAKDTHSATRVRTRWFEVAAHTITIPARPYLPVRADGSLYPAEQAAILAEINEWLASR